ncbi:autotransporter [Salmonella bongori]|nr:autotransporter [Salmonella bongori]
MKFRTAKLSSISLAIAYSLYSYNAYADASNHISTKGDQVVNISGINITDDYYSYYTDGSIDMTVTDSDINTADRIIRRLLLTHPEVLLILPPLT